ncbi:putative chromatin-remodeling complex ATPase chain [Acorus calamus]|uniref:Chromatin-remodeling complex ATPase chain n=1 Tax=Acorus calamus TaxID=4465 RepID=A0AAV9F6N8_ACOCL|nr:putative chromatin-remodeling complex ATPase chain [Acorus calamus]
MKRVFEEISDDEWENHSFKPSRVLGTPKPPPPPIESFAYNPKPKPNPPVGRTITVEDLEDDDVGEVPAMETRSRRFVVVDDDDDEEEEMEEEEEDSWGDCEGIGEDFEQVIEVNSSGRDEKFEVFDVDDEEVEEEEEDDVIGKALQKCSKISAELRRELYGSSSLACDSYAETEVSSFTRIVTQDDIDAACMVEDSDFKPILKPYQIVGVNFLLLLYKKNIGGAILADEMGLGKTVQAITYLTLLRHLDNDPGPHLIVSPASVLENWERELKRWCPSFSVVLFHGTGRTAYSKELNSLSKAGLPAPFNVLLVCYSLFERQSGQQRDDRKMLKRWQWSCVLMDEAHVLKDKSSYRWKNLMSVAKNANQRLMLTGTPLQNDLHELWSLLEFMMPAIFATGDVDVKKLLDAEDKDLISRIKSILGPFILRRLKSDVMQQLVPKIQQVKYVSMEPDQAGAYKDAVNEYRVASQARLGKFSEVSSNNVANILPKRQISNYFLQLRKIANHPLLVRRIYSDADVVKFARILHPMGAFGNECTLDRVIDELKGYNDFAIHQLISRCDIGAKEALTDAHVLHSAKCQVLAELLPLLHKLGHRVLIFSQWTSMLDILEWAMDVLGFTYRRLDGSTQVTERQRIVDAFNNDPSIFACLLSTRAGGQGLNLIGADTVVIHDMDFNPQMDRQAEDRCHRIGQTKPVTIYRLVTKGTVDENIYEIAKRKLVLDAAVLEPGMVVNDEIDVSEKTMGEILSALLLVG